VQARIAELSALLRAENLPFSEFVRAEPTVEDVFVSRIGAVGAGPSSAWKARGAAA